MQGFQCQTAQQEFVDALRKLQNGPILKPDGRPQK